MAAILTISGSPQFPSRTDAVVSHVARRLAGRGHEVTTLLVRDLPPAALLAADVSDPAIAAAVAQVAASDAIVVASPVYKAAYSGLLKAFLDLLPQFAFQGKDVLPVVTGGSPAHVLAVDYALRPVLASMNPAHIGQGWFISAGHVTLYPDGGVLLDEAAARPLFEVVDSFAGMLEQRRTVALGRQARPAISAGSEIDDVVVVDSTLSDPAAAPLLADLRVEYGTRYARFDASDELRKYPDSDFEPPNGTFVLLSSGGETIAGGAIRRYDAVTAEIKRVWTSPRHRRRGLARRVLIELERRAVELGYQRLYLTTGPRQPEAAGLYLTSGFTPAFDVTVDPETIGPLPFSKELAAPDITGSTVSTVGTAATVPVEIPRRRIPAFAGDLAAGRAS